MSNFLITGANSFLGRAIVKRLSQNPVNKLLLITRSAVEFDEYNNNENIFHLKNINLLEKKCLSILSEKCVTFFKGKLNTINCVGYYKGQEPFEKTTIQEAKKIFDSNFVCVYNTANAIIPYIKDNGGGHFICFSCKSVKYHYPLMAPFSASKAALDCLVGTLANEFSKYGFIANSFSLSTLDTDYERKIKPYGDFYNWLKLEEIVTIIENIVMSDFFLMNGNTIDLFKYSESFFNKSYFDRIKK